MKLITHGHKPSVTDTNKPNNYTKMIGYMGYIGPSAVQSEPRAQRFPLVSSPKETSRREEVRRRWWGARKSHYMVQRADGRLLWLGDTEAGSKT